MACPGQPFVVFQAVDMAGTITALKAQKHAKDRVNVYLDGEFAFGLSLIHALWLRVGQALSDKDIETLQQVDTLEKAKQRAVELIAYRPRSVKEVRQRLRRAGVDEAVIDEVVASLIAAGLLDDESFTQTWVDSRLRASPRSKRMVAWELRQKGVEASVIEASLAEVNDEETAYQAALRRWPRVAGIQPERERRRKLGEHLARHGFDYDTMQAAVERVEREMREAAEQDSFSRRSAPVDVDVDVDVDLDP